MSVKLFDGKDCLFGNMLKASEVCSKNDLWTLYFLVLNFFLKGSTYGRLINKMHGCVIATGYQPDEKSPRIKIFGCDIPN